MRSKKQIAASRKNGRKSRGAVTPEGKARVVTANLRTGVFAETHTLPWEAQDDFDQLREEYYSRHPPASPEARFLLDQLIMCEWQMRRFHTAGDALWRAHAEAAPEDVDPAAFALHQADLNLQRLQYRVNSTNRAFHAALKNLERLELRDHEVTAVGEARNEPAAAEAEVPNPSATPTVDSRLHVLGSLRSNPPDAPDSTTGPPHAA